MSILEKVKRVEAFLEKSAYNGGVSIANKREVLFSKGYGMANIELDVPITSNTVFRIASITKQLTATAILQLCEHKMLTVEDTIDRFIPDYPNGNQINIHQILTHISGISNFELDYDFYEVLKTDHVLKALIDIFKDRPLQFKPGTQFAYSVSGFLLLGYIIELLTGLSYEEYLKANLFEPLGMKASGFDHYQTIVKHRASPYDVSDGVLKNAEFIDMRIAGAGGGLYASIEDINRFNIGLRNGKIISDTSTYKMFDKQFKIADGVYSGYGIFLEESVESGRTVHKQYHAGGGNGVRSINLFYPKLDVGFVLLSNVNDKPVFNQVMNQIEAILIE